MPNDKYVTLVLVKHNECDKPYLFYAPLDASWKMEVGTYVAVKTIHGIQMARVAGVNTARVGSDDYKFAVACADAYEPLQRVLGIFKEVKYEEEDDDVIPFN